MPGVEDGAQVHILRDLEELSDKSIALSDGAMLLVSFFDGRRTAAQVRDLFCQATDGEVDVSMVQDLAAALEEAGLLETTEIAQKRQKALEAFRSSPRRAAVFAGPSYAAGPKELSEQLDAFFLAENGPGKPRAASASRPAPLGLMAPHIDFQRGGPVYAWAYQALSACRPPDAIIALGVAHSSPDSPWIFTPKKYETPFGPMELDGDLYDDLTAKLWYDPRADEWVHKNEHSLEFQAAWLRRLWGEKTPPWVPILVSSFERFSPDEAPSKVPTIEKALKDLEEVVRRHAAKGRKVMVLAGVDLAHVGPRFGDEFKVTPELEKKVEDEDRRSLVDAMSLDCDGFYRSCVGDGSWRKVCGLSALYTALRLIESQDGSQSGRLLAYGQAPDPAGGLVSFASALFEAK